MSHKISFGTEDPYIVEVDCLRYGEMDEDLDLATFVVLELPKMGRVLVKDTPIFIDSEAVGTLEEMENAAPWSSITIRRINS